MNSYGYLQKIKINFFFLVKSNLLSISLFSLYGLFSNTFSFLIFFILVRFDIFEYKISYVISSLVINTINYFVYSKIFKSLINLVIILMVEIFGIQKYLSHILSNIFLATILYILYKYFVYSNNEKNV